MIDELVKYLKINNQQYKLTHSVLFNYTFIVII